MQTSLRSHASALSYQPEVDGLRALAVLSVLGFHAFPALFPGGFVGVDVFFVISGYIITRLLLAEWTASGRIDLPAFYARRVRRIFPMLVLVVVCTLAASMVLLPRVDEIVAVGRSAAASLLFVGNIHFQLHTGGYFDPAAERLPLLHLWSLGVEEQFYLLWPLFLIFLLRRHRARAAAIVGAVALGSVVLALGLDQVDPNAVFYQMPTRFWELAAGGLIVLRGQGALRPQGGREGLRNALRPTLGVVLVFAAVFLSVAPVAVARVPLAVAGAALLLLPVHRGASLGLVGAALRCRPALFFGLRSYSLYLWHWPLLALARAAHAGPLPALDRALLCMLAVALAAASFRWIENPLRRPNPATPNRQLVLAALLASFALAWCSVVLPGALAGESGRDDPVARISDDYPANRFRCHQSGAEEVGQLPRFGCSSAALGSVRVAIWGDSYALAWQPFAWAVAERQGVAAIPFSRDACPPLVDYDNRKPMLEARRCRDFNDRVLAQLDGLDTIVIAAAWLVHAGESDFKPAFEATLARFAPHVGRVLIMGPTPYLVESAPTCTGRMDAAACSVERSDFERQAAPVRDWLRGLEAVHANVHYVEPVEYFCDAERCPAIRNGQGLYWDRNHVAASAARDFAERFLDGSAPMPQPSANAAHEGIQAARRAPAAPAGQ